MCTELKCGEGKFEQEGEKNQGGEMTKGLDPSLSHVSEVNRTDGVFNVTAEEEHGVLVRFLILIVTASITSDSQMTAQCQKAYIKDPVCAPHHKSVPCKHRVIIQNTLNNAVSRGELDSEGAPPTTAAVSYEVRRQRSSKAVALSDGNISRCHT